MKKWWQRKSKIDKFYFIAVSLVVVIAFFFRSYNLKNSQQFLGDQGRDALIVARIFKQHDLVFIGPVTSVGNMYLGPLYYYWMLPWLRLSYPSPMGPIWAMVFLGTLAVVLTYFLGKELVGRRVALTASVILALMPAAVMLSRFSWNPNPAPLVSLLMIWATWRAVSRSKKYWLLVALSFAVLIQLHYVTLLTLPAAGLIWFWQLKIGFKLPTKSQRHQAVIDSLRYAGLAVLIVFTSLTPLLLFDLKHQGLNRRAFMAIMTEKGFSSDKTPGSMKFQRALKETHGRSMHVLYELTLGKHRHLNTILVLALIFWLGYLVKYQRLSRRYPGMWILLTYLGVGVVGLSFYTSTVFDHYVAYLYPVTALVLGLALGELVRLSQYLGLSLVSLFLIYEISFLLQVAPWRSAGLTLKEIETTSMSIYHHVKSGEIYNLVLLDDSGDLDAFKYRYFLETTDHPPTSRENRDQAKTLFIIDERSHRNRKAIDSPAYEIVVFPDKNPTDHFIGPDGQDIWVLKRD